MRSIQASRFSDSRILATVQQVPLAPPPQDMPLDRSGRTGYLIHRCCRIEPPRVCAFGEAPAGTFGDVNTAPKATAPGRYGRELFLPHRAGEYFGISEHAGRYFEPWRQAVAGRG